MPKRRNFDRLKAFAEKIDKRSHYECWEWLGVKAGNGYGQFWDGDTMVGAQSPVCRRPK